MEIKKSSETRGKSSSWRLKLQESHTFYTSQWELLQCSSEILKVFPLLSMEEIFCALADSKGSVPEATRRLNDQSYQNELKQVCGRHNVKKYMVLRKYKEAEQNASAEKISTQETAIVQPTWKFRCAVVLGTGSLLVKLLEKISEDNTIYLSFEMFALNGAVLNRYPLQMKQLRKVGVPQEYRTLSDQQLKEVAVQLCHHFSNENHRADTEGPESTSKENATAKTSYNPMDASKAQSVLIKSSGARVKQLQTLSMQNRQQSNNQFDSPSSRTHEAFKDEMPSVYKNPIPSPPRSTPSVSVGRHRPGKALYQTAPVLSSEPVRLEVTGTSVDRMSHTASSFRRSQSPVRKAPAPTPSNMLAPEWQPGGPKWSRWHAKLKKASKYFDSQWELLKCISEIRKVSEESSIEESFCALVDSKGSVEEALRRLSVFSYQQEVRIVCEATGVKDYMVLRKRTKGNNPETTDSKNSWPSEGFPIAEAPSRPTKTNASSDPSMQKHELRARSRAAQRNVNIENH